VHRLLHYAVRLLLPAGAALLLAGCTPERGTEINPAKIKTGDDIVKIVQFWPQSPWLQEGEHIVGFKVTVYFVSGQTEKGTFVPGTIFAWLYELVPNKAGGYEKKLAYVWQLDEADALGFRINKRGVMGYHYGFPLRWPDNLALEGKLIEIQLGYERLNKSVIQSSVRRFRVPVPMGYESLPPTTEP